MRLIAQVAAVLALVASVAFSLPEGEDQLSTQSQNGMVRRSFDKPFEVLVKTLSGATIKVKIELSATIVQFRERIQEMTGVPCNVQRLIFEYQILLEKKERTLRESGLESGSPVFMVLFSAAITDVDKLTRLVRNRADDLDTVLETTSSGGESSAITHSTIFGDPRNWIFELKPNWRITEMFDPIARPNSAESEYAWLRKDALLPKGLKEIFRAKCLLESLSPCRRTRWPFEYPGIRLGSTWQPGEQLTADVNNYAPDNLLDEEIIHLFVMGDKIRGRLERDAISGEGNLGLEQQKAVNRGVLLQYESALAGFALPSEIIRPREDESCAICKDELHVEPACRLPCNHSYHTDCIQQWVVKLGLKDRAPRCPYCREPFRFLYGGVSYDDDKLR